MTLSILIARNKQKYIKCIIIIVIIDSFNDVVLILDSDRIKLKLFTWY